MIVQVVESYYHEKKVLFKLYCEKLCHRAGSLLLRVLLEVFCKKSVLKNFAKLTGKHLSKVSFLTKLQASIIFKIRVWRRINTVKKETLKKETLAQVFSCELCKTFTNNFSIEHASGCFLLFAIQVCMYTQLQMSRSEWYTFHLMNSMRLRILLNNWEFINLQCFKPLSRK